ncbi:hypothetical protein DFH28DRAFT_934632 [Melampsora americana]|nr:hypothetical protein DFH28DRAFT_934632 [Melampsora americana]
MIGSSGLIESNGANYSLNTSINHHTSISVSSTFNISVSILSSRSFNSSPVMPIKNTRSNQSSTRQTRASANKLSNRPRPTKASKQVTTKKSSQLSNQNKKQTSNRLTSTNEETCEAVSNQDKDDSNDSQNEEHRNENEDSQVDECNDSRNGGARTQDNQIRTPNTSIFCSRFPGLELNTFEDHLPEWTLVALREANSKQAPKTTKASQEINGEGAKKGHFNPWIRYLAFCHLALQEKLPTDKDDSVEWGNHNQRVANIWKGLKEEEEDVFQNPYFFALANLPDLSNVTSIEDETEIEDDKDPNFALIDASTAAPRVHKLTEAEKEKYLPIYNRLVNVEKLHSCHGKPEPTQSVATLQKQSLLALRKAHHDRYQISYYATAVSCGTADCGSQTFSNNTAFAHWAATEAKVPGMFASYIQGKSVAKTIEAPKPQQPSDERKTQLGHQLNELMEAILPKTIFPKKSDPEGNFKENGWLARIVQKEGSLLSKAELHVGHRLAKSVTVKRWLDDIKNKRFIIEAIPESELLSADGEEVNNSSRQKNCKGKTKRRQHSQQSFSNTEDEEQEQRIGSNSSQPDNDQAQPRPSNQLQAHRRKKTKHNHHKKKRKEPSEM